jgi:hypothetical protein
LILGSPKFTARAFTRGCRKICGYAGPVHAQELGIVAILIHLLIVAKGDETEQITAMRYTGKIRDGVVVLEGSPHLKEGTLVVVEPIEQPAPAAGLGQRLKRFSGSAKGLPAHMARNHDHYLHGRPKR